MNKYLKFSLIFALAFIAFFYFYIELYNQYLQSPTNSLEASNTTIQFILLITGIITIVFLYINYDQQREQLKEQKKEIERLTQDSEYNRIIDITYRQIEIGKTALNHTEFEHQILKDIKSNPNYVLPVFQNKLWLIESLIEKLYVQMMIHETNILKSDLDAPKLHRLMEIAYGYFGSICASHLSLLGPVITVQSVPYDQ